MLDCFYPVEYYALLEKLSTNQRVISSPNSFLNKILRIAGLDYSDPANREKLLDTSIKISNDKVESIYISESSVFDGPSILILLGIISAHKSEIKVWLIL
jgi:hypothetical protein